MLLWTALFVASLLLQYMAFSSPPSVLAIHDEGLFELDGDAFGDATPGDDWNQVYNGTSAANSVQFIVDPVDSQADDTFTGGSSKDDINSSSWLWKTAKASQAKNDITHAFAAAYTSATGDTIAYFGLNKYEADGNNFVGFWFFQDQFGRTGAGNPPGSPFSGAHTVGDVLVLANYTNGGALADFDVLQWVGTGGNANAAGTLQIIASGVPCTTGGADDACGATNGTTIPSPWPYQGRDGAPNVFPPGTFFEAGINLTALGLDTGCYTTYLAETRSSQSVDATLSDFALGDFSFCAAPELSTQVSTGTVNVGESVTDTATISGDKGPVEGTIDFFVCGPDGSPTACETGGTKVGATKTISSGSATSDPFTVTDPAATGYYCFRAEFTPAAGSKYLATDHTNATTECFQVIPAGIDLVKTADAASVSAGDPIGFTITITSTGPGVAFGVKVSDTLPTNAGLAWTIDAGNTTGAWSIDAGVLSFGGASGVTMANGDSYHVHITSPTTAATCGAVDNTGSATTTNDGSDSDSASVTVLCPDVTVSKTPDGDEINAGDTAAFSITVSNLGPGAAADVSLSDPLPAGVDWTLGAITGDTTGVSCQITGAVGSEVLSCSDDAMAAGESFTVAVSGPTDAADCGTIPNLASVAADNEPAANTGNNTDAGSIAVSCAQITITKTADDGTVNAGDQVGFTVTVGNIGDGDAYGVTVSDPLPAGFAWSIESQDGGWSIGGGSLSYGPATLAAGASSSVHITAISDPADCGLVNNTATVTTTNDGSDEDSDSITVLCPDVTVVKSADNSPISAGDVASYTITVSNLGPGMAYGVTLSDTLPAGIAWTDDSDACSIDAGELTCDFGDLASGAQVSVTVSGETDAADCGLVPNTAVVAADNEPAANTGNNESSASIVVNCPDIAVTKVALASPVNAGDGIAFAISVFNLGPGTAYGVTLSDTLPAGIAWTDDSDACSIDGGELTCDFGDLASGAQVLVMVSGTTAPADCGLVPNTAVVAADNEPAANTGNNEDSDSITVLCPDVTVVKSADNSPISAGDLASYTITVSNLGPGTAYGVTLSDTLPAGIAWTDDSDACSIDAGELTCDFGDLASGAQVSVTVSGETDAADCGLVPNTAVVAADNEPAANTGNNESSASIVVNCPLILITKSADDPVVNATDQIGFVITVTNNGEGTAADVEVEDILPTDAGLAWSIDEPGSDPGWSIDAGTLRYGPADLAAGASVSVHIVSPTTPATCGTVDNAASVTTGNDGSDDDSSSVDVLCPDVTVVKSADNSPILAGQAASYTITVSNLGPGTAYGVTLSDTLPAGIAWTDDSDACSIDAGELTCDFGDLASGAQVSVTVSGETDAADCGLVPNTAVVAADNEPAANTGNNESSASITVQCASIEIVKTAGTAADGDEYVTGPADVLFTYLVTNTGSAALVNVAVVDDNATPGDPSDDIAATCPQDSLDPGESMICTATLPVDFGLRVNLATVTANPALDPQSEVSDEDDAVVRVPQLTIVKSFTGNTGGETPLGDPEAKEGDVLTYTLAYDLTDGPVTDGIIVDTIPVGLDYVDGSAAGNAEFDFIAYDSDLRTLTWTAASVTADGTVTYQVQVAVGAAELAQPLVNVVTIDSNETASDDDAADVYVEPPPEEATGTPRITTPPTNSIDQAPSRPGPNLLLVLVALAGLMLAVGYLTPAPARARRRSRRG